MHHCRQQQQPTYGRCVCQYIILMMAVVGTNCIFQTGKPLLLSAVQAFPLGQTIRKHPIRSPFYKKRKTRYMSTTSDSSNDMASFVNTHNHRDQIFSAISKEGGIKVTAVTARNLMNDLMIQHSLSPIALDALGRTLLCAMLMANGIQKEQVVQISLQTPTGPIRGVMGVCNGQGHVRGYVGCPQVNTETLREAMTGRKTGGGGGVVQIVKNHPSWPRPYNGITAMEYADVDRDIGRYLATSEQRSCALAAATSVVEGGLLCNCAGGYLIEQLPDATEEEKEQVERNLAQLVELDGGKTLPTNLLLQGYSPVDIAQVALEGLEMQPLGQIEPSLKCECTEERLLRSLVLLPAEEVEDILTKEEKIEARCEFCGVVYRMGADEAREKLKEQRESIKDRK